jgi:hypothetical protein
LPKRLSNVPAIAVRRGAFAQRWAVKRGNRATVTL